MAVPDNPTDAGTLEVLVELLDECGWGNKPETMECSGDPDVAVEAAALAVRLLMRADVAFPLELVLLLEEDMLANALELALEKDDAADPVRVELPTTNAELDAADFVTVGFPSPSVWLDAPGELARIDEVLELDGSEET